MDSGNILRRSLVGLYNSLKFENDHLSNDALQQQNDILFSKLQVTDINLVLNIKEILSSKKSGIYNTFQTTSKKKDLLEGVLGTNLEYLKDEINELKKTNQAHMKTNW